MKPTGNAEKANSPKQITFQTDVVQTGNNTGIHVPDDVVEALGGGKRPLVVITVGKLTYRSAVATMGGKYMVALSAENRAAAGVQGGDAVKVAIQLDLEPRTVEIPPDLRDALVKGNALDGFEKSAPSKKKEYVRQVESAKAQETRERRIATIVNKLVNPS